MFCCKGRLNKKYGLYMETRLRSVYILYFILHFSIYIFYSFMKINFFVERCSDNYHDIQPQLEQEIYPYTNKWYTKPLDDLNPHDKRCPKCKFTIRSRKSNSGRDDFLMTTLISKHDGYQPLIRNFRTTQTNARLIIFIDESVQNSLTNFERKLPILLLHIQVI